MAENQIDNSLGEMGEATQTSLIKEAVFAEIDPADPPKAVEGKLRGGAKRELHCRYWRPTGKPKALVMLIHGLGEHLQWYDELGRRFAAEGLLAFGHDHIGHGLSDGDRVHVESIDEYITDVFIHYDEMKILYPDLQRFAVGHSMGGMILLGASLKNSSEFNGIVLMGPLIMMNPKHRLVSNPIIMTGLKMLSFAMPHFSAGSLDPVHITRDAEMREKMAADTLRWTGGVKIRWMVATHTILEYIHANLTTMSVPFLLIHGDKDQLCDVEGSKLLFDVAPIEDKEIKIVQGGHHHLYIEPLEVRNEAMGDTVSWVVKRVTV